MIITLVHGTFSGSKALAGFAQKLKDRFPHDTVTCFEWSGLNSNRARSEAANRLAASLQAQSGPHFIVGHSHGGNVALRAAGGLGQVVGVATLNSPFLSVHLRRPMFQALLGVGVGGWIHFSGPWLFGNLPSGIAKWLIAMSDYGNWFLVGFCLLALAFQAIWSKGKRRALLLHGQMDGRHIEHVRVCVIRRPGDEASALLGGVYTLDWVLHRIVHLLLWIPAVVWAFFCFALMGLLAFHAISGVNPDTNPIIKVIAFIEEDVPMSKLTAISLILFVGAALTQGLAFGPEFAWLHPWIYCSVDSVPAGRHETVNLPSVDEHEAAGWFHSRIYSDEKVVDAVSTWIAANSGAATMAAESHVGPSACAEHRPQAS